MWPKITLNYSPNFNLPKRSKKKIKFIVIHYTGMKKESEAIQRLCDDKSKVSSHYFIKKDGTILRLVPDLYEAWHAGKSKWKKTNFLNRESIGIEIHNTGHKFKYEKFSSKQMNSLKKLLKKLIKIYNLNPINILGHSDISPDRKQDPGEKFPWKNLAKSKLVYWHSLSEKKLYPKRLKKLSKIENKKFLKNLYSLGYKKTYKFNLQLNRKYLTLAFQRRFRPSLVNGKSDQECYLISKNLLKS